MAPSIGSFNVLRHVGEALECRLPHLLRVRIYYDRISKVPLSSFHIRIGAVVARQPQSLKGTSSSHRALRAEEVLAAELEGYGQSIIWYQRLPGKEFDKSPNEKSF